MTDNMLLELIRVLNKQLKKDRVTEADIEELDLVITGLDNSQIPDYQIAANITGAIKLAMRAKEKLDLSGGGNAELYLFTFYVKPALDFSVDHVSKVKKICSTNAISNNNKYLLKKIIEKAIENITKSKEYAMSIQVSGKNKDTIANIVSNLEEAENILKGEVKELNQQFVDKRNQEQKISESATQVYNSYLLLYKLNELRVNNGKSLNDLISEAINTSKKQVEFKVEDQKYRIEITQEDGNYKLKVLGTHTKPEVKDVLKYTDKDIISLWANSEVSIEKDPNNNVAFAVGLHDGARLRGLKVGGLGKKVPFNLRFANFYKVIEILKDKKTPLKERFRLANNIATGSGKTGDIALLKLWAYLVGIPCITLVPSDTLRDQSNKFDKEFLPDEVAIEFEECFSETNTQYATTTFKEALDEKWNVFNDTYGKDNGEQALILSDEAPKLKEKAVLLARAIAIARNNPTAFFSATPDAFLSEEFKIILQILLSPKERAALGVGKLAKIGYYKTKFKTLAEMAHARSQGKSTYEWRFVKPEIAYTEEIENTYDKLNDCEDAVKKFKNEIKNHGRNIILSKLSQPFLDFISKSLDSQAYKAGLIITEERWAEDVTKAITNNDPDAKKKRIDSFVKAIKGLNTGLGEADIKLLVKQNLNVEVGGQSLPYIKLHSIIDTFNEYKKSNGKFNKTAISKFINNKYDIIDSSDLKFNSQLTNAILKLGSHQDYKSSIKRNYSGDKELHKHIFQKFPEIKEFCEQDVVVHYFNKEVKCFDKNGKEKSLDDGNAKNMLNIIKAGFVPNTLSKELAIGIDAPRLSRLAIIIKGKTDIMNPMTVLQAMGRVGRDVKVEGLCYFDVVTSDESYLEIDNINTLSGEQLRKKLEESYEHYIQDEKGNIEGRSALLISDITQTITFYINNPQRLKRKSYDSIHDVIIDRVKDEFNFLNIQYCCDKETVIRVFTEVLQSSLKEGEATLSSDKRSLTEAKRHGTSYINYGMREVDDNNIAELEKSIMVLKSAVEGLKSKTKDPSSYWSCVAHAPIMTQEQIVNNCDPNSDFPIFIKQKEKSQRKSVPVLNASAKLSSTTGSSAPAKAPDAKASTGGKQNVGPNITAPNRTPAQTPVSGGSTGSQQNVGPSIITPNRTTTATTQVPVIKANNHQNTSNGSFNHAAQSQPIETLQEVPLEDPSTTNESPQRTSTKKKVVYGFIIAAVSLAAVGIYTAIVFLGSTGLAFNPAIAAGIFIVAAVAVFGIIKLYEKVSIEKQENPDIGTCTTIEDIGAPENLTDKTQDCPIGA